MAQRQKAELLDLVARIIRMHSEEKMTFKEIEARLRAEGYDTSRESIRRTVKSNKSIADELMKTREETVALVDAIRNNPGTDTNEATLDFLVSKAFEFTKGIEDLRFKDPMELAAFISKMTRSKAQITKLRLDYNQVFERAKSDLISELRMVLAKEPDLMERMCALVSQMVAPNV